MLAFEERDDVVKKTKNPKTLELHGAFMATFILCAACNVGLFLGRVFNSEQMILFDSVLLSVVSMMTFAAMSILSRHIRVVLMMVGALSSSSTMPQVRRITAITLAANIFFVVRVSVEVSLGVYLIMLMRGTSGRIDMRQIPYLNALECYGMVCEVVSDHRLPFLNL